MRAHALVALFVVAAAVAGPRSVLAARDRPDIVVVLADDMGMSDLGCGGGEIRTTNLDRLAANGLRFTRFYNSDKCSPTRAALLTGVRDVVSLEAIRIRPECATAAEILADAGYATAMVGKWHLALKGDLTQSPTRRGFQRFYGTILGATSYWAPASLRFNEENATADCEEPDFYYTDAITQNAVWMIEATPAEQPLFLYVAYTAPHWPLHAWPEDVERYRGRYAEGWDALREERFARMRELGVIPADAELSPRDPEVPAWEDAPDQEWEQRRMEVYAAQIDRMDQGIGRIVSALEAAGRLDDTLFLFLSDNGACAVEYEDDREGHYLPDSTRDGRPMRPGNVPGLMPGPEDTFQSYGRGWANASATPFRLFKEYAHEGGVLTPLIVHWPAGLRSEPGAVIDQVGQVIDLLPTFLDVAGVEIPAELNGRELIPPDGTSLLPVLEGGARPQFPPVVWNYAHGAGIREGDWKLVQAERTGGWWTPADVWRALRGERRGSWELYDLAEDPTELRDLAKEQPERAARLKARWRELALR
ncbi:MAG TPA: arylsulfatase [bacterium]|nr:arylsulfatase [bacterium]